MDPVSTRIAALYGSTALRQELREDPNVLAELYPYIDYLSGPPEPRGDGMAALRFLTGAEIAPDDTDALGMAGLLALGDAFVTVLVVMSASA